MKAYNEFAYIYDDLMKRDFNYKSWFAYIEEIFKDRKLEPEKILEMGCGTGNLSEEIAKKGYDLTMFDLSVEMLSIADSKVKKYKNVEIFRQNMIDFDFMKKFDAVISVCDSINYILEDNDLFSSFQNVYDHLHEGGIFIFDINSKYKLKHILGNNIFIDETRDVFYSWENFYYEESKVCEFLLNFFVTKDGSTYKRFTEQHFERAYEIEEIEEMLIKVGFSKVQTYEAFTFDKLDLETERINFVVEK